MVTIGAIALGLIFFANPSQAAMTHAFAQKVDHLNAASSETFPQYYAWDSSHVKGDPTQAPVIYEICMEVACDYYFQGWMPKLAEALGAHLVALEHRYYGRSQPRPTMSTEDLRFLTMEQALADLVDFENFMVTTRSLRGPWIAVGASYGGTLAAFLREKFPDHVLGALASSAPVSVVNHFESYDRFDAVRLGAECNQLVMSVVRETEEAAITARTTGDSRPLDRIKALFHAEGVGLPEDLIFFLSEIVASAVQQDRISEFCNAMKTQGAMEGYASAGLKITEFLWPKPTYDTAEGLSSTRVSDFDHGFGARQWEYQSCHENHNFKTANTVDSFTSRSSLLDEAYYQQRCLRIFGPSLHSVPDTFTNQQYYQPLLDGRTTQILFTNGENDPWGLLSIEDRLGNHTNPHLLTYLIPGAAHGDDIFGNPKYPEIQKVRQHILDVMRTWLRQRPSHQ